MRATRRPLPLTWVRRRISGRVGLRSVQLRQPLSPSPLMMAQVTSLYRFCALDAHAVRATFFPLGNRAVRMPDTVRAVVQAGHEIGLHGWRHERFTRATVRAQLTISSRALFDLTGSALNCSGPRTVSFPDPRPESPRGWAFEHFVGHRPPRLAGKQRSSIVERVLVAAHPGAIILLHDGGGDRAPTVAALTAMIPALRRERIRVGRVSDLLATRASAGA